MSEQEHPPLFEQWLLDNSGSKLSVNILGGFAFEGWAELNADHSGLWLGKDSQFDDEAILVRVEHISGVRLLEVPE